MDLSGHQARDLFGRHGIAVPRAEVTDSPKGAREIARRLGGHVVVKAQVKTGGRGKAGGVKLAADPAAAEITARQILGMDIKGHTVRTVMVAEPVAIESEFYVSYVLDRAAGGFLAIASAEGGMDIEEVAATRPEAVARIPVDPAEGVTSAKASEIAEAAGLPPQSVDVLMRLWQVLTREDALLVEINPLVGTEQGRILALDGKVTLDDNASFRQTRLGDEDVAHDDPLEAAAAAKGLTYVRRVRPARHPPRPAPVLPAAPRGTLRPGRHDRSGRHRGRTARRHERLQRRAGRHPLNRRPGDVRAAGTPDPGVQGRPRHTPLAGRPRRAVRRLRRVLAGRLRRR
jgi:succinyl-CoA synthetase beta subunit